MHRFEPSCWCWIFLDEFIDRLDGDKNIALLEEKITKSNDQVIATSRSVRLKHTTVTACSTIFYQMIP